MKLSIVIPCFNCSNNIINIIDLLAKQVNSSVEVLFINDGSTDNTAQIISDSIEKRNLVFFHLYSFENSGAAKARSRGLELSNGEYVFFLDSDDIISKDFINNIFSCIQKNPDMIYFSSIIVSSDDPEIKISDKITFVKDELYCNPDEFICMMFENKNWTSAVWSYVFRRELAVNSNAYFTDRVAHEDHIFTLRLVGHSEKIQVLKDILYLQKRTAGSLTTSKKSRQYILERFRAFEESRDDMKRLYSKKSISLYERWSIFSFIHLCFENIKIVVIWLLQPKFYYNLWKYHSVIFEILASSINKKIKRLI
ncbi:glycosyltransferase family 2 protein [Klebsiella oxytoca]|uniref:glycosyltransferase family 2 protein n=1 Tax=Klebsiella oxytoca TaxID=571 RepID=UPI002247BA3A|nr:glycosyltransferase family 2 protein [Klebsiella oxytoca]MCW9548447.1 glycosyltransferase family 2 protein [Klebsiella oxytoca]WKM73081.1 glycosyltransferase family 2 protein [Klebsiella oxytoca]HBM3057153.1 glycosyltransferase family 2 protein [Klebsiella oxytoca]HED4267159.1 glycosyltransferase family 2 protein [Klebsiella oxytoca]